MSIEREPIKKGDRVVYHDWWHHTDHTGEVQEVVDYSPSPGCSILFDSPHPKYGASLWLIGATHYGSPSIEKERA